jgi:hypothetical protein
VVVVGGFEGYYDARHRFVSSAPGIRIRVQQQVNVRTGSTPIAPRGNVNVTVPPKPVARSGPQQVRVAPRSPSHPAPVVRSAPRPPAAPAARSGPSGGGRRK